MAPVYRPNSYTGSIIAIFRNLRLHLNGSTLVKSNTMQHTHDLLGNNHKSVCSDIYVRTDGANLESERTCTLKVYEVN